MNLRLDRVTIYLLQAGKEGEDLVVYQPGGLQFCEIIRRLDQNDPAEGGLLNDCTTQDGSYTLNGVWIERSSDTFAPDMEKVPDCWHQILQDGDILTCGIA